MLIKMKIEYEINGKVGSLITSGTSVKECLEMAIEPIEGDIEDYFGE